MMHWYDLLLTGLVVGVEDELEAAGSLVQAEAVHVGLVAGEPLLHVHRGQLGREGLEAEQHSVQKLRLLFLRHARVFPPE